MELNSFINRIGPWLRLGSEYTLAHFSARLLAAISGLLLVRLLPVNEYGLYTILLSAFTFICTFSDLGITETLAFFRRRASKKNKAWIQYFYTVIHFRRALFLVGFILASIYIFSTGHHIGSETTILILGVLLVGLGTWFAILAGINTYVLKLEQYFRSAYVVELGNEGAKLTGVGLIWILGLKTALSGMVCVSLGAVVAAILSLQKLFKIGHLNHLSLNKRLNNRNRRILLSQILPILPGTIYFAFQGPLIAWLAVYYGSVENVAQIGALGRISILVGVITGFTSSVFVPRLIAIKDDSIFLRRYFYWWIVIIFLGVSVISTVSIFEDAILSILGDSYAKLYTELMLSSVIAIIYTCAVFSWQINRALGLINSQPYRVPFIVFFQAIMFILLDFSKTQDVLLFSLISLFTDFVFQTFVSLYGFTQGSMFSNKLPKT